MMTPEQVRRAFERIDHWRVRPGQAVACPRCEAVGLRIVDKSARPHAEWYEVSCAVCGLSETMHRPLSPPSLGGDG